jgi:hypothetical protein
VTFSTRGEQFVERRFFDAIPEPQKLVDCTRRLRGAKIGFGDEPRDAASMAGDEDRFTMFDGGEKLGEPSLGFRGLYFAHGRFLTSRNDRSIYFVWLPSAHNAALIPSGAINQRRFATINASR